jgi:hypothetical protein
MITKMKECGACSECCKPEYMHGFAAESYWCPHVKPKIKTGCCAIYNTTIPKTCSKFICVWLQNTDLEEDLRPDRCGTMIEMYQEEKFLVANVNIGIIPPHAIIKYMSSMVDSGWILWIRSGNTKHLVLPKGATEGKALQLFDAALKRKIG